MHQKAIKLSLPEISCLYYYSFNNNKFFLIFTNKKQYKYFSIPSHLTFVKREQTLFFSSIQKDSSFLNTYLTNFVFWLKQNNKAFKKKLLLKGLGFRAFLSDDKFKICFKIGFSHILSIKIPKHINNIIIEKNYLTIEGESLSVVGNFCM